MYIHYPTYQPRIKKEQQKEYIFDEVRKQWVRLTPEEWVRQNFLNYLIVTKQYPASLIAVEKEIKVGEMRKRFDILVYQANKPWMIIECKELNVALNELVIKQMLSYYSSVQTKFMAVTNGNETHCFQVIDGKIFTESEMPEYYKSESC